MSGSTVILGSILLAVGFHTTDSMVYHLALLSRHGDHSQLQDIVGEIHYHGASSEPKITNEVGCVWNSNDATESIKKMSLPKNGCIDLIPKTVSLAATGFKVESNDDFTLHVYQSNNSGALADGYLAIPDEHLGTEYYVNTYCSTGGYCQFAVLGTVDSTSVNVVFPQHITPGSITCNGQVIANGEPIPLVLNENEVLHIESIESKVDLSGTYITSDKNVAVFIGARDVPGKNGMSAFMIEQVPPVNKWGTEHVVAPNYLNDAGDIIKIIAKDMNTEIHVLRDSPFTISNAGETVERRIDWELHSTIISSKPVLVIQIMSLDLYNDSSIVKGNPAAVIVPHVEQWTNRSLMTDCLQKSASESILTMTAKTEDQSSFPWNPPQNNQFTHWTDIDGSDYSVLMVRTDTPETGERESLAGNSPRALYGYCDGTSAILYYVDWEWENEECVATSPVPGDGIDNDCDGEIDEDTCTESDLAVSFSSTQDPSTLQTTIKSFSIKNASPIRFTIKTCGIAKIILKSTEEPIVTTSIQITKSSVIAQTCSPVCEVQENMSNTVSDCTVEQKYKFSWRRVSSPTDGTRHTFKNLKSDDSFDFTIDDQIIDYDVMYVTAFASPAEFVIDLPEKDCSKVISGEGADNHGLTFLAPFKDGIIYEIHVTNPTSAPANVQFFKASDMTQLLEITVPPEESMKKIRSDLNTAISEQIIYIKSDNEISIYASKYVSTTSSSGNTTGFPILPVDILGPNYNVYLDRWHEPDSTPSSTNICMGYSLYEQTVSNIGEVNDEIGITKGNYDAELGHQKRFTSNRPVAVFCGTDDRMSQMPPIETLGKQYYIPPINYNDVKEVTELRLVAIEDSTVVIIRGNYDNLDTIELTGNIFTRTVVKSTMYNITSTKPIQVHLLMRSLATPSEWAAMITIPPVEQYKTNHVFPGTMHLMGNLGSRTAIDEHGAVIPIETKFFSSSAAVEKLTYPEKTFALYVIQRSDGGQYLISGDMNYADINKVCDVTEGSPGDGIDNDCDGLIDEEQCTTNIVAGEIDDDIDGNLNKDCASGTTPFVAPSINLGLTPESVTCPTSTGGAKTGGANGSNTNDNNNNVGSAGIIINNGVINANPPSSIPDIETLGSAPTYLQITGSSSPSFVIPTPAPAVTSNTTNSTNTTTAADTCVTDCACPCGWVEPPKNYTKQELEVIIEEIQEKLKVSKNTLSSVIRSKSSAKDGRTEAAAVGIAGIVFIVVMLGAILLLDLATIARDVRLMVGNLRQVFQP